MICQECKERPATLHFTKTMNGMKTELHLCEKCAREKGEQHILDNNEGFSINNLLGGLLNFDPVFSSKPAQQPPQQVVKCTGCNMTFQQFVNMGKFGCANCYETFKEQLSPILKRLHSANTIHQGKIPKRVGDTLHLKREVLKLQEELQQLIQLEEFEKAANIRDQIRSLQKKLHSEGGES